jgi:undecaprenyl-diphosphatase
MEPNNTQSWSTRLFLSINKRVGKHPLVDKLMTFAGDNLVFILVLLSLLWATTDLEAQGAHLLAEYIKLMITAFAFGIGLSWTIGWLRPNPRPVATLPKIRQLIEPLSTWKSFPSDHTIGSFTVATVTLLMGAPLWLVALLYAIAAFVALGRVYIGVHYPRDIVGGFVIGMLCSLAAPTLLVYITQPIYTVIIQIFV